MAKAQSYAELHGLVLTEPLGFGIHGIVRAATAKFNEGKTAIKVHRLVETYRRERDVYQRLRDAEVRQIRGFHVPQLFAWDDDRWIIEMSIVTRPFVLDFAGAYLDFPPEFSDEVWSEWERDKREQFGGDWPKVLSVLGALEDLDIHMIDVSPSNIAL